MPPRRDGRTRQSSSQRPRPRWARPAHPKPVRQPRDWIQISVVALPGLAAVIALIFTWVSVNATNNQLQIAQQGQITDRYNAAIANLGDKSTDVRLGGIYALQRIMEDSPRDQPTVIAVLCAFVRDHANSTAPATAAASAPSPKLPTDIQAALTVVGSRNTANDGSTTYVDFSGADLTGAHLNRANLKFALLTDVNLTRARIIDADFTSAQLRGADLTGAHIFHVDFTGALLTGAKLTGADLSALDVPGLLYTLGANLTGAFLTGADLTGADLTGAKLTGTKGISTGGGSP